MYRVKIALKNEGFGYTRFEYYVETLKEINAIASHYGFGKYDSLIMATCVTWQNMADLLTVSKVA